MRPLAPHPPTCNDHAACSGCSLCLLVCPVWRATRDPRMSPEGRAKALQNGATAAEIAGSIQACTLCAACEPVCPERIDLIGMTLQLRRQLGDTPVLQALRMRMAERAERPRASSSPDTPLVLLYGPALGERPAVLARVLALIEGVACEDDGADIALALEAGAAIPAQRLDRFLTPLRMVRTIVVDDGLWLRHLRAWLPRARLMGLGEALSRQDVVRRALRATDLYVIEPRAYHANYERMVKHYNDLRAERGCAFNLDLQRIAIPATARSLPRRFEQEQSDDTAQARWILKGRNVARVVVESAQDRAVFERLGGLAVVHLAELAEH